MAGIGFTLERMTRSRDLASTAGAYVYAALLVAGPWIFTVLGIGGVGLAACAEACENVQLFRTVIIYNSVFSLILTSPIAFVCTRFISDQIFQKRDDSVTFAFVAGVAAFACLATVVAGPFYIFATTMTAAEKLASFQNLMLIGTSWLLIPFLGAMRGTQAVSVAFAVGAIIMVIAVALASNSEPVWLLNAFNLGLAVINSMLIVRLMREFGVRLVPDPALLKTAFTHWELPLIGITYGLGIWIDKLIMWFGAPSGTSTVAGALRTMPDYDTPMFWAQLAALPVIAVFFVHIETNFFRLCRNFYGRLEEHASLRDLRQAMSRLSQFVRISVIGLFAALATIGLLAILLSLVAVDPMGLRASQMGVLRAALIGMVCHTSAMFCFIFFLYFDLRRAALTISTTYLLLNGGLTLALLPLDFPFYGYGNMLAAAMTFLTALVLLMRELPWLHYHAFVTNNTSLQA